MPSRNKEPKGKALKNTRKLKKPSILNDQTRKVESQLSEHISIINEILEKEKIKLNVTCDDTLNKSTLKHEETAAISDLDCTSDLNSNAPIVCDYRFNAFLKSLKYKNNETAYEQDLNVCLSNMNHQSVDVRSKIMLYKAICDSILKRKWNNLTYLLNIVSKNYDSFYAIWPLVTPLLLKLHPIIQQHNLEEKLRISIAKRRKY